MVKALINILLLFPCFLFSAEFTASVSRNEVGKGEGFVLYLTLKDAHATTPPSLDDLKHSFIIKFQQQASSTMVNNNKVVSTLTWTYYLIPQILGEVRIPPISVETQHGMLFTQPITMQITKEVKSSKNPNDEDDIQLETVTSKKSPYKNEPFLLTVRVTAKQPVINLQLDKFEIEGAILESGGEPQLKETRKNGLKVAIVEFNFLVTPLKAAPLTIRPIVVQGATTQHKNTRAMFNGRTLFDDNFDPFFMMQGVMNFQPFSLMTEEFTMQIRPPVPGQTPWLPAMSLDIQENWDDTQTFKEGEVFTRYIVMTAEGIHSSQLPSLEGKLGDSSVFKIYADKPVLKDEMVDGMLKSSRIEQYTMIPQKSGALSLPQIAVGWWDTTREQKKEALLPARQLQVLPAPVVATRDLAPVVEQKAEKDVVAEGLPTIHPYIYAIIGSLTLLLTVLLLVIISMQRKMNRLLKVPQEKKVALSTPTKKESLPPQKRKWEKLDDLNPT